VGRTGWEGFPEEAEIQTNLIISGAQELQLDFRDKEAARDIG
jgi:hypothetical protein